MKHCGGCQQPKSIHFFSPSEWKKTYDKTRRCNACVKLINAENRRARVPGREVWREGNGLLFAREK